MEEKKLELEILAIVDNLPEVKLFVGRCLMGTGCSVGTEKQIMVAVEEVFVNVSNYAYGQETGHVKVCAALSAPPRVLTLTFIDRGVPFNPLDSADPDLTISVQERKIGGLGIFLTKAIMDSVTYRYESGQNILTLQKNL